MLMAPKRMKEAIWRGKKNITPGHAHALILMPIASNIIQSNGEYIPLRDVQASLSKQFAHVDDEFETFSILIDDNWCRIMHVA